VPNFVPPADLRRVLADLPPLGRRGSIPPGSLRLGRAAKALIQELEAPALREGIADRFGLDLTDAPTC
jgi:hypothetical protein